MSEVLSNEWPISYPPSMPCTKWNTQLSALLQPRARPHRAPSPFSKKYPWIFFLFNSRDYINLIFIRSTILAITTRALWAAKHDRCLTSVINKKKQKQWWKSGCKSRRNWRTWRISWQLARTSGGIWKRNAPVAAKCRQIFNTSRYPRARRWRCVFVFV